MKQGPLSSITVIEMSTYVAAPACARLLGDLGARVIKVESFTGDPWRKRGKNLIGRGDMENPIFDVYNIGKESICINIKNEQGMDCLLRLLENADVFITNTRIKSLKKLKLDAESLASRFPRLVIASVDGFGPLGPDAESPGFDNVAFWTRSGFLRDMAVETEAGGYPVVPPTGCGDSVAGSALGVGIMSALFNRERTGKGDIVSVSLYGTAIWTMSSMIIRAEKKYGEQFPIYREQINPLSCQYRCADGEWFCITVLEYDRLAPTVYRLMGIEDLIKRLEVKDYPSMWKNRGVIVRAMEASFLQKSSDEWVKIFGEADIVSGTMNHFSDVEDDPQAWINGYVKKITYPNGETGTMPLPPIHLSSQSKEDPVVAPQLGEQTKSVLQSVGFSDAEISTLISYGAVN